MLKDKRSPGEKFPRFDAATARSRTAALNRITPALSVH
jgi:hypothetical protein